MLNLIIKVKNGRTACGSSRNIIGCEPDRELLELNGRDYTFALEDNLVLIGNGPERQSFSGHAS